MRKGKTNRPHGICFLLFIGLTAAADLYPHIYSRALIQPVLISGSRLAVADELDTGKICRNELLNSLNWCLAAALRYVAKFFLRRRKV